MSTRRSFLKASGLSALPLLAPALPAFASDKKKFEPAPVDRIINFIADSDMHNPAMYLAKLNEINAGQPIAPDIYHNGGAVAALEKKFAEITGKERAIFMPTGTMANQLAIKVLSGENAKVVVQETSHVYRDEADAAQSVHNKRLVPLPQGKGVFTLEELQKTVEYHKQGEVFASGVGVVSIESPVRRNDGQAMPIDELRKVSAWCKQQGFKLHLDGARLHMASAWTGVSIAEYAALFDTVYISLYKYLGAGAGAILCGDSAVIDKMVHLIKIFGGTMFRNWHNAAVALHYAEGIDAKLKDVKKRGDELIAMLNKLPVVKVTHVDNGTNIYLMQLSKEVKPLEFGTALSKDNIRIQRPDQNGLLRFTLNETVLYKDVNAIYGSFKSALGVK